MEAEGLDAASYQDDENAVELEIKEMVERDEGKNKRWSCALRVLLVCLVCGCLLYVFIDALTGKFVESTCLAFLAWVQQHPAQGFAAVILVYAVSTVLFVPGALLTVGAGFTFQNALKSTGQGVVVASLAVFLGAYVGSVASFLLGRYLFRDFVVRLASRFAVFRAVDRALEHNGLRIMILLRLSPLIPYNALDYISGITSISLWRYSVGLFFIIPGVVLFTFVGATTSSLINSRHEVSHNMTIKWFTLGFGIIFAIAGVWVASYYSKRELDKILEEQTEQASVNSPLNRSRRPSESGSEAEHQIV